MLGVVLVHFNGKFVAQVGFISKMSSVGARCPQLFFIISAFLTWMELERRIKISDFIKKKYVRIAPLYYIFLLVALLLPNVTIDDHSAFDLTSHILFINGLNPYWNNCINVEWYISDLAIWYLVSPLLHKYICNLRRSIIAFAASILVVAAFIVSANAVIGDKVMTDPVLDAYFHTQCILIQIPVLFIGVILYYVIKEYNTRMLFYGIGISLLSFVFFEIIHMNKRILPSSLIAGMLFGCLFLVFAVYFKNANGPIAFIGKHSFGVYLCHMIIIRCISTVFTSELGLVEWLLLFALTLLTSTAIGTISETLIKKGTVFSR